jgi:hypothetical protein
MGIEEPSLEEVIAFAGEHLGLDPERDPREIRQLAAIGLTIRAWRNTSLEDLHAGSHPSGGFPDSQMMRFNIATTRVVFRHIEDDRFDWDGLRAALTDPHREFGGLIDRHHRLWRRRLFGGQPHTPHLCLGFGLRESRFSAPLAPGPDAALYALFADVPASVPGLTTSRAGYRIQRPGAVSAARFGVHALCTIDGSKAPPRC